MKISRVRRWFAAGVTGALFGLMLAASAGPVAADGIVTTVPGQDPNAPVQVVSSPGYYQTGAAAVPGNATTVNGTVLVNGQYYYVNPSGQYIAYYPTAGNFIPGVGCGGGLCGYTAAGPIVGFDGNGSTLVYDVRGGLVDAYTTNAQGRVCEADSRGNCQKNSNVAP